MNGNVTSQTSLKGSQSFDRETQGLESAFWSLKKKCFFSFEINTILSFTCYKLILINWMC